MKKKPEIEEAGVIVNEEKVVEPKIVVEPVVFKPKPMSHPEKALYYEKLFGGKK